MDLEPDGGLEILVIEDNDGDARLIEHTLRSKRRGIFTTPSLQFAGTLEAGLERLASGPVDLVLLDLGLPGSDGLDTLDRMHAGLADTDGVDDVPIVVLTGLEDDHLALEAIQQGAQDYLVKGNLDADTLDRAIRYGLERHRQERRLRRQAEQLEDLATAVSHDIRTPLDTAMGHLRIVAEEHDHESLDRVEHALTRIDDLTDDLLALVREGRAVEETAAVDLAEVARSAWHTVPAGDATLEVRTDATVRADRKRLYRVFENLFANAVEHGSSRAPADALAGGATDVTVRVGTTETGFYVADDGPGLDTDAVERVFDAGYTTAEGGAGYGLTIVANAVEAHGWDVRAGRSETGGARFDVGGVTFVAPSGEG